MRIWHKFAGASLFGACAFVAACSSSSSGGGTNSDASTSEGGDDGSSEAAACPADANVATFDSGTAAWACVQKACGVDGGLLACGDDCACNVALFGALQCVVMKGGVDASQADTMTCFAQAIGRAGSGPELTPLVPCITLAAGPCAGIVVDGGEGGASDGGGGNEGGGGEGGSDGGAG